MTIKHNKESGFTLVELAIVMIIIGLLIGGILKGQELIANAQTTATIAQIKGIDGAISTFDDKYAAMPGDMPLATNRLPNCNNACATGAAAGNQGNGRIDGIVVENAPGMGNEGLIAFIHMAAADLISGIDTDNNNTAAAAFGSALPEAEFGGGYWIGFDNDGTVGGVPNVRRGHYLVVTDLVANTGAGNGISASQAAQVDRKMDDGDPAAGDVFANPGNGCVTGGAYDEQNQASSCDTFIRIQS